MPIPELIAFMRAFPRIDVILNINYRTYQLMKSNPRRFDAMGPEAVFAALNKKHWLVKRTHKGGSRWLLAVGRNIPAGEHKGLGLHKLESEAGKAIIEEVEGKRQGELGLGA